VTPWHVKSPEAACALLGANADEGLDLPQASARLAAQGPNELPAATAPSALKRFLAQLANPIVLTLIAAAVIATLNGLGHEDPNANWLSRFGDAAAIAVIVVLNAALGYYQEQRAEAALDTLKKLQSPTARVRRSGVTRILAAKDVVAGDILELEAGDAIAADARLLSTTNFATLESAITGEPLPIPKNANATVSVDCPLGDRSTMVFTGTSVVRGKARALVVATSTRTELGKLSVLMNAQGQTQTPLEEKLEHFGNRVLWSCLAISVLMFAWGIYQGHRSWHVCCSRPLAWPLRPSPRDCQLSRPSR